MPKIVAAILTKNEAGHIAECIKSVQWTDKVIIQDSFSDDDTVQIAESLGAKIFQSKFVNFATQRNIALDNIRQLGAEWVFFIDADERVTPALANEIQEVVKNPDITGWWVPRYNQMWGHTMRGGGWYPDHQLRLMRVDTARYDLGREVHEIVMLEGQSGYLNEHLIHYNYISLAEFRAKQNRYIDFEAKILADKGIKAKPWTYITMPVREFIRRYISLEGYKDGWLGVQLCGLMSWYMLQTYLRLRKL